MACFKPKYLESRIAVAVIGTFFPKFGAVAVVRVAAEATANSALAGAIVTTIHKV